MKRFLFLSLVLAFVAAALLGHNAPSQAGGKAKNPVVVMKTSMGTIKIELFADKAPITVKNFLAYTDAKHYDGLTFHRVIPDFMIQGGVFKKGISAASTPKELKELQKPTKDPIVNEAKKNKLSNLRGTLSMARTGDPDSATSQFFINVADNNGKVKYNLDPSPEGDPNGYAVFGKVIEGMDVVDKIKGVKTKEPIRGFKDVPVTDVVIESIRLDEK